MIKSAGTGYVLAELATAQMYRTGMGVLPDWNEAMKWYSLAAGQGNAVAENDLGSMYIGIPASAGVADAAYWYRRAADAGYVVAEINLAGMYMRGIGVPYDPSQAIIWYCKAAAQESIDALLLLGQIYRYGRGIPEDDALAQQMFQKAADHVCMSREQCASEMRAIINAHKAYPSDAVQARVEGASVISFDYKGGKPLRIHVDRSSGYVSLDKAAIAAVGDSLFPVLGSEMKTASHFQVEVDFTLDAPGFLPGANSPP
jgi:TonB family protein